MEYRLHRPKQLREAARQCKCDKCNACLFSLGLKQLTEILKEEGML